MKIVISSGHGKHIRGASDIIDEVDEARRVVATVAEYLDAADHDVVVFHDDVSTSQNENLERIVDFHNTQDRDLDVSVHFNAYEHTEKPMGTECLFVSQNELAAEVAKAISDAGELINRGGKKRSDLYFLNHTDMPSILIETCFVDSTVDTRLYEENFELICEAIAATIAPIPGEERESGEVEAEDVIKDSGRVSWFGGPEDMGVDPDEGLAFLFDVEDKPHIFLDVQPEGTTGLARRLDPRTFYVAMRWDYDVFPKDRLAGDEMALVRSPRTKKAFRAHPADWGPHEDTDRIADISPGLMEALGIETDDEVEVIYPAPKKV